jgi:hypothetical protein
MTSNTATQDRKPRARALAPVSPVNVVPAKFYFGTSNARGYVLMHPTGAEHFKGRNGKKEALEAKAKALQAISH